MKILVTGGKGFIGSHLVKELGSDGHEVYTLSKRDIDLKDKEQAWASVESIAPEVIYHLAANAAEGRSIYSPIDITENSIATFLNTIVPAINTGKLKRVVFTSSIAVYGEIPTPFKETNTPQPVDIYGVAKRSIEMQLEILSHAHDFDYVIARPHNVFGENQNMADPYRNVVTLFMNHILRGKPYYIFGDGSMKRQFSYVGDVVKVLSAMSYAPVSGHVFNIGADRAFTIKELSDAILDISGSDIVPIHLPARLHEVWDASSDHTLQNALFGYRDTDFFEALEKTWEWVKKQGAAEYQYLAPEINHDNYPKNWRQE